MALTMVSEVSPNLCLPEVCLSWLILICAIFVCVCVWKSKCLWKGWAPPTEDSGSVPRAGLHNWCMWQGTEEGGGVPEWWGRLPLGCLYCVPIGITVTKSGNRWRHEVGFYDRQPLAVTNDARVDHQVNLLPFERHLCLYNARAWVA